MLEAALFRLDGVPGDVLYLALHGLAGEIQQLHAVGRQHRQLAVGQEEDVAGVVEHGGDVGSDEVFILAQPDHRRRPLTDGDDLLGVARGENGQSEDAAQLHSGAAHGFLQRKAVAALVLLHQMGDDLGVGLGYEAVAFALQLFLQGKIVFDDAVVHHHHGAVAVAVGMGVLFAGPAVGGPAGVPDAVEPVHRLQAQRLLQVVELALAAADVQPAVLAHHRDAGRVVAAILQPLEPVHQDGHHCFLADVTDYSAHISDRFRVCRCASACPPRRASGRQGRLVEWVVSFLNLATELFNHGIGQHLARHPLHFLTSLLGRDAVQFHFKYFALAHVLDVPETQPAHRLQDGLPLWVEYRLFQRNVNSRLHPCCRLRPSPT